MDLTLDIGYFVKGRRPGKMVARSYRFMEAVTVDIPEVDPMDAPVAVEWTALAASDRKADAFLTCGDKCGRQHTRWMNGIHWLRLSEGHLGEKDPVRRVESLTANAAQPLLEQNIEGYYALGLEDLWRITGIGWKRAQGYPAYEFDLVSRSWRDETMVRAEKLAQRLISVDGQLYLACAQPGLRAIFQDRKLVETAVEVRAGFLDGWEGFRENQLAYGFDYWEKLPPQSNPKAEFEIRIEQSIDPDIVARRNVDTRLKVLAYLYHRPEGMDEDIRAFLEDTGNQRAWRITEMAERYRGRLWPAAIDHFEKIIWDIEEFEDRMTVSLEIGEFAPPSPKP